MCAVMTPSLCANAMRSPACKIGTRGSGGAKQPHARASRGISVIVLATSPATARVAPTKGPRLYIFGVPPEDVRLWLHQVSCLVMEERDQRRFFALCLENLRDRGPAPGEKKG